MVSLINFKIVNEELHQHQIGHRHQLVSQQQQQQQQQKTSGSRTNEMNSANNSMFIRITTQHEQNQYDNSSPQANDQTQTTTTSMVHHAESQMNGNKSQNLQLVSAQQLKNNSSSNNNNNQSMKQLHSAQLDHKLPSIRFSPPNPYIQPPNIVETSQSIVSTTPNFVVTWRNLKFAIEPKWHQRMVNINPMAAITGRATSQSDNNRLALAHHQANNQQSAVTKIVLDKLDGSFRSGELTAILGPSGAGKTTLLDCLTGHRKHGLSGSIKISSSSSLCPSSVINNKSHFHHHHHQHHSHTVTSHHRYPSSGFHNVSYGKQQQEPSNNNRHLSLVGAQQQAAMGEREHNLKVSIIPQNDHLMGHLTVYETLNYASKMKNCFSKEFDHKLNVRRVAQQLGLMSCLGTRVNKLSGGQYKRVSIAQELLSSPDILILDEPTSGLDAMTCYQTVQVLRKLTDDRQTSGQNQIAVILTIHQPNSDVFQQFNHVYVVAQGGKCIYEGPPASIESVINRVGIRLPNSYYNPATMIVEIAAGKFGVDAIHKLNSIQKKQYDFVVPDEQNSTGDSAVDCPSSSSNDEDDERHSNSENVVAAATSSVADRGGNGDFPTNRKQDDNNNCHSISEINNNVSQQQLPTAGIDGLVNKGFVMENEDDEDINNNKKDVKDVIVVVPTKGSEDADSMDKIKMVNNSSEIVDNEGRRKKRRRTRKRSGEQSANNNNIVTDMSSNQDTSTALCAAFIGCGGGGGGDSSNGSSREKRLKLNSLKADQKFPFWRHTYLHFHRSWLSIVRDPMLCSMQLALHILVPVMVSLVYGTNVGKPNACPRAGPMDIMAYALEPTDSALQLQEDLRTTLENIGYIFFKLYGIIFAAMTVTVLTFPLDMHVLVKEFRNGWYGLSSYFLGRTLADIPFQLTLPLLAMSLSYYATGQPYSYMQWRFLSITAILILSSLIAQSQGLLFGAILMDRMKAAVFVAPAATTPIILFAGFLVRTQSIPRFLRPLSNLSYLRYAIEACLISRYGFNQCECDPAVFNQTVPELPPIARSMLDYWLSSFKTASNDVHDGGATNTTTDILSMSNETTTPAGETNPDLFTKLIDSLAKANSFGRNITSCEQVVPYPMIDYDLKDSQLFNCFAILLFMLVFTRLLTFFIVCFKVKRKV